MTTANIGSSSPGAFDTWAFSGSGSFNQWYSGTYGPAGEVGRMIQILANFGGDGASTTGGPAWWSDASTGATLVTTPTTYVGRSVPSAGRNTSGGTDVTTSFDAPFSASVLHRFGFFRNSTLSEVVSYKTGAFNFSAITVSGTSPGSASGGSSLLSVFGANGSMKAYGTYYVLQVYVRRAGAWTKKFWNVRRSGAMLTINPQVSVRRSGSWTQVDEVVRHGELDWAREFPVILSYSDGSWEQGLAVWDYDQPRYMGVGYPGWKPLPYEPTARERGFVKIANRVLVPA